MNEVPDGYTLIATGTLRELIGDERMAQIEAACTFPVVRESAPEAPSPQAQGGEAVGEVWIDREAWDVAASEGLPYDATLWPARQKAFGGGWHDQVQVAAVAPQRAPVVEGRWYCLTKDGLAELCANEADAIAEAHANDIAFPNNAPHQAVQLVPVAAAPVSAGDGEAAKLWCLHIEGPDDVHAAPSRDHAQKAADLFNARFSGLSAQMEVMMRAEVAPWPHSAASHAEDVGRFIADWLIPRWQLAALTSGASGVDGRQAKWAQAEKLLRELGKPGMADSAVGFAYIERQAGVV